MTAAARPLTPTRLDGLDALRGIAALWVVAYHWGPAPDVHFWIERHGYLAVDFFFLLSGFVLSRTYDRRLADGTLRPMRFMAVRIRRFWPLIALGGALGLAVHLQETMPAELVKLLLFSWLCVPTFFDTALFPLNVPQWSLFFELVANAAHARWLARADDRTLVGIILVSGAALVAASIDRGSLEVGMDRHSVLAGLARVGFSYGLGMWLWRRWGDRPPIALSPLMTLLLLPAMFLALDGLPAPIGPLLFVALGSPLLLAGGLNWRAGAAGRVLGAISFPLYALHWAIILAWRSGLVPLASAMVLLAAFVVIGIALGNPRLGQRKSARTGWKFPAS